MESSDDAQAGTSGSATLASMLSPEAQRALGNCDKKTAQKLLGALSTQLAQARQFHQQQQQRVQQQQPAAKKAAAPPTSDRQIIAEFEKVLLNQAKLSSQVADKFAKMKADEAYATRVALLLTLGVVVVVVWLAYFLSQPRNFDALQGFVLRWYEYFAYDSSKYSAHEYYVDSDGERRSYYD